VHRCNHGRKVGGDLTSGRCQSPLISSSVPSPSPVIAPHMFRPFPSVLQRTGNQFLLHLSSAWRSGLLSTLPREKKRKPVTKVGGAITKYTWSPLAPVLEGTRPTGLKGRLRLCATAVCLSVCLSPVMMCRQLPRLLRRMRGQRLLHGFRESRRPKLHLIVAFVASWPQRFYHLGAERCIPLLVCQCQCQCQ